MNSKSPLAASNPKPVAELPERFRPVLTVITGLVMIAIITPLTQFLTILTINTEVETSTPVGWALGVVFALVLSGLGLRQMARCNLWGRAELALLYTMLAIAVPLMNLGLIRPFFNATHAVLREYLYQGTSTYRTAYNVLDDRWFPKVPTREGLAFNRADRLLRFLEDGPQIRTQQQARRTVMLALTDPLMLQELQQAASDTEQAEALNRLLVQVEQLSFDGAQDILNATEPALLEQLGLLEPMREQLARAAANSDAALSYLAELLPQFNEWQASLLPRNVASIDFSARERLTEAMDNVDPQRERMLREGMEQLAQIEGQVRSSVSSLSFADRSELRQRLTDAEARRIAAMDAATFDTERNDFAFRLTRSERRALIRQDGINGPNQNLWAAQYSLWSDAPSREARDRNTFGENFRQLTSGLPWGIYAWPMLSWGTLFVLIFFFMMCLAEYFRRKWVSRENLSFPLVEVADHLIRHDYRLEQSGDGITIEKRSSAFSSMALMGFAVGFLMLFFEALGHYGFINQQGILFFNLNESVFNPAGGAMRDIPTTLFVISPIVVGLVFLLSLEIGFSIWFCFLAYTGIAWLVKIAFPNMQDSAWTGFGDGRMHPYPMEQLLGACLVFAIYIVWKSRSGKGQGGETKPSEAYLPPQLTRWGLILSPLAIFVLLWSMGIQSVLMIVLLSVVTLAVAIAAARVRAETGLPTFSTFYESTKLPIIFGLPGLAGAKSFAAYINVVFLPVTLLFRTLPQQLENMELARRYRIPFRTVAISSFGAFLTALSVGMVSFLLFVYYIGQDFYGGAALPPQAGAPTSVGLATYPLWVSHFLGEMGLDRFADLNWFRIGVIAVGGAVVGLLLLLRNRFLRFPINPIGYLVILLSIHFSWVSPYMKTQVPSVSSTSIIWGGALVAWGLKKLIVKYGGMNSYKRAKPFFVAMVIGAVFCIFFWNVLHLGANLAATQIDEPGSFIRRFLELTPYIPAVY